MPPTPYGTLSVEMRLERQPPVTGRQSGVYIAEFAVVYFGSKLIQDRERMPAMERMRAKKRLAHSIAMHPELRVLSTLTTPRKVQDFLDTLPINHERRGETCSSPLVTLRRGTAHCMEGALVAALALWMNGQRPLVMDLKTSPNDVAHLVTLFRVRGYWGGITKTNHAVLRYREPIFRDLRELAASYFHEYTLPDGRKTLRAYSEPFDLRRYPHDWILTEVPLWDLDLRIEQSRHFQLVDRRQIASLRRADDIEIRAGKLIEWR